MQTKNLTALFAPGDMTYTSAALTAMKEAGTTGLSLIYRHIRGDWGGVDERQRAINDRVVSSVSEEEDIVSRYQFPGDIELVLITSYVHTPSLRWTEIVLPDEIIPHEEYRRGKQDENDDDAEFEPLEEVAMVLAEMAEESADSTGGVPPLSSSPHASYEILQQGGKEAREQGSGKESPIQNPKPKVQNGEEIIQGPGVMQLTETTVTLAQIRPGPYQNRTVFKRLEMENLAQAIESEGLIHPPIVFLQNDTFHLLAGERRWRAMCALTLAARGQMKIETTLDLVCRANAPGQLVEQWGHILQEQSIPVRLDTSDQAERRHRLSVIDNAQHQGLNPIEEARDYLSLKQAYGYSDRQVARAVGKSERHIQSRLRWLELAEPIQELVATGALHRDQNVANALLGIPDPAVRLKAAQYHARHKSSIKVIVAACEKLGQMIAEEGQKKETEATAEGACFPKTGVPMLELASSEQEGNGHSLRDTDFRRAAQGMCHKCSIGQQHSPEFPEPAWAIIVAEATYLCDQCQLQRVRQVCQKCPGVALLRRIVEQGELEVISDG